MIYITSLIQAIIQVILQTLQLALSHTTNEPIALNAYTVSSNNHITAINALLAAAEAGVTGTITDNNGSEVLNTTVDLTTTSDDTITVDVGTLDPSAANLAELKKLADQDGITRINGNMTISAADIDTISAYGNLTTSNNYINFTLDNAVTVAQASTLAGKTSGTVAYDAGISDSLSAFASASARTTNFNAALAKDGTVDVTVTGTQTTADHISALNLIVAGQTSGQVTATISANKTIVAGLSGFTNKALNTTVSDRMSVSEFDTLNAATSVAVTLTSGLEDSLGNLAPSGSVASGVTAAMAQDADANVVVTGTVSTNHAHLHTLAAAVGGTTTASVSGTISQLTGITNTDTNDPITFTISSGNASVSELKTLSDNTSLANISFTSGGIADSLSNLIDTDHSSETANLTTALAHLSAAPTIALTTVTLSHNNNIIAFNNLASKAVGAITGQLTDDNGTYLLATTGGGVTQLVTSADDVITLAYGTVAASDANITKLISNAQINGSSTFTGSLTSVSAAQAATIGSNAHINDQTGGSNNTSTMTFTTDEAVSPTVASNLAGKGTAVYGSGLTGAIGDYSSASALTSEYDTASTEDTDVAVTITGTLSTTDHISALNRLAAETSGNITATITAGASVVAGISGISNKNTTITVNDAVSLSGYNTADATTSNAVQVTGSISDSLNNLYDASNGGGGSRAAVLNTAIAGDNDLNIVISDSKLVSGNFGALNAVVGNGSHSGTVTATVEGTATQINDNLGGLSATDVITFTVTGGTKANLANVDTKTSTTITVSDITDSASNLADVEADTDLDLDNADITITGTISKSDYDTVNSYNSSSGTTSFYNYLR